MCITYSAFVFRFYSLARTLTRVNTQNTQKGISSDGEKRKKQIVTLFNRTIVERTTKRSQSARKYTHTKRSRRAAPREIVIRRTHKHINKKTNMTDRKIGFEELCKHDKIEDLWLAIDGIVYDVTPFMDDHPGGGEIMLSAANKDGTDDFEDVGHSPHARELLKKFKVGVFEGEFGEGAPKKKSGGRDDVSIGGNAVLGMVLPVLVLLCAIAAYYMGTQR